MTRNRWIRRAVVIGLVAVPLLLWSGGWFKSDKTSAPIDPPQVDYELETQFNSDEMNEEVHSSSEKLAPVTLYYKDQHGFVAPIGLRIPAVPGIAKLSLEYMVDGGPSAGLLPPGFSALIPKGTTIDMNIVDGLAIVDFSEHFTQYNPQDERKIVEAIAWTLTGFNTVDKVQIWVGGKVLKQMPVDGMPLDEPLTRKMGINLERAAGVNPAMASAVTLYFQNQSSDEYTYYVPVTRLIRHTDDLTAATVRELVKGPMEYSRLANVMNQATEILNVQQSADLVMVNFDQSIMGTGDTVSEAAVQALILTLTEQTGVPKVQIMVNGESSIISSENSNYSAPVSRPSQVNPIRF